MVSPFKLPKEVISALSQLSGKTIEEGGGYEYNAILVSCFLPNGSSKADADAFKGVIAQANSATGKEGPHLVVPLHKPEDRIELQFWFNLGAIDENYLKYLNDEIARKYPQGMQAGSVEEVLSLDLQQTQVTLS